MPATSQSDRRRAPSKLDPLELGAWRGLLFTHSRLTRELDAELVAEHNLPLSSYEVLLILDHSPDNRLRMSELADSVLLSRSGLTRLCDRLVASGYVVREACPGDARSLYAVITPAGQELLARARKTHFAGVRRLFLDHLDDEELEVLSTVWERIMGSFDESPSC